MKTRRPPIRTFTHTNTHNRRSILAAILAAVLIVCLFPALAFAWPLDAQWISLTRSYSGLTDIISDSQGGANDPRDIVTNDPAYPAAYVFNDGTYMYYRIRVDGDALNNQGNGLQPFGWGFVIDTDNDFSDYEWMVMLNGISNPETIIIGQNTVQSVLGDPSDKTELTVWSEQWMLNVNFRTVIADSSTNGGPDYFLDFRIPYATFKAKTGLTDASPIRFFIGSSNNAQSLVADLVDISDVCKTDVSQCMPANSTDAITPLGTYPATGTIRFVTGLTSTIDLNQIYSGQTIHIRVEDADLDTNRTLAQTVQVTVTNQHLDSETVTLTETGLNTGIFTGQLTTTSGAAVPNNGSLQVAAIETVTVTYVDSIDASYNANRNRTDTLTVQKAADLSLAKSTNTLTPAEGTTVVYTLTVTNNGPDNATGVQVTDNLPAGVTWTSDTGAGSYNRTTGVWEVPVLASGASTTLSLSVTVNAGTTGSTITNTAAVTASAVLDPVSGNNSASRSVTVGGADLALTKTVNTASPPTGGSVVFTIGLTNLGSSLATGVTVTDTLSSGLTYSTSSATQGSYNSGTGTWTVGSLASGATVTLSLTASVTGSMGTSAANTAAIATSSQADPNSSNNSASVFLFISGTDLSMAKTVNNAAPNEGNSIVYTLSVTNGGLYTATSVTVSDLLPAGLTYVSSAGTGTYVSGTGLWSIPTLNSGATVTRTITATVNAGTNGSTITNTATITGSSLGDPNSANNSASAVLTVQRADLSVTKTSSNPSPNRNQAYSYTVALRNLGPHSATTITVRDVIDTGNLTYNSASATAGSVSYAAPTLTWSVPTLVSGATVTLTIGVTVKNSVSNGVTIQNMAEIIGAAQADPVNANNQSIVPVVVGVGTTDIAVAKSASSTAPSVGGTVTYTVVASNVSPTQATNVTIGDALPGGLTYSAGGSSVTQGNYNPTSGIWTVGTLNSGATATMLLAATVNAGTTGWTITNTALLTGATEIDINAANDTASATLVVGATDLAVTKTVNDPIPNVGNTVTYTVGLTNNGPNNATTITVADLLPPGLTYVSAVTTTGIYTSGTGSWSIATLNSGATATLTLNATVNAGTAGTTITNTATRTSADQPDNVAGNNSASTAITVQSADLMVTKIADNLTPQELSPVVYTVTVTNNGPHEATNVVVQDLLSSDLTYSTHVVSQGTYSAVMGLWTIGSVAKSTTKTLQITARPNLLTAGTNVVNTAFVTAADQADPAAANNSASITITPVALAVPNIVVLKSTATVSDPYNGTTNPKNIPGAIVEYTITVTNFGTGGTDDNSVYVVDPIPANTELFVNDIGAGYGPVAFADGSPSSGLSLTYTSLNDLNDGLEFSTNGTDFSYGPVTADPNGCDSNVNYIRFHLNGAFAYTAGAPRPSFTIRFRVRVK